MKPADFFINVTDFFSVLLPGALVVYFLKASNLDKLFRAEGMFLVPETELQGWLLFLLATYIVGHIIFLLGSLLMDKLVYNRFLRNRFFKKNYDLAYHSATLKRNGFIPMDAIIDQVKSEDKILVEEYQKLAKDPKREILNTYKWALNYFALHHPEVLVEVKKLEADSKFFRSLVIAFLFIGVVLIFSAFWSAILLFVLALLSAYRYGDLRYKSSQKAYELIVTKFHNKKLKEKVVVDSINENREQFQPSKEKATIYEDKIRRITAGLSRKSTLLSIDENNIWTSESSGTSLELYCLEGKGSMTLSENSGKNKSNLSPGAIINVPPKTAFKISNLNEEPLLLVSVA